MKTCKWCKELKSLGCFYNTKTSKDGKQSHCKDCHSKRNSEIYHSKRNEIRKRHKEYYELNHEKEKEARRQHYRKNKASYLFNYYKRDSRLKLATPSWLTEQMLLEIKRLYKERELLSKQSGEEYHVDHIVPLQGENVCGLHVPWNLRVIKAKDNLSKGNKYE